MFSRRMSFIIMLPHVHDAPMSADIHLVFISDRCDCFVHMNDHVYATFYYVSDARRCEAAQAPYAADGSHCAPRRDTPQSRQRPSPVCVSILRCRKRRRYAPTMPGEFSAAADARRCRQPPLFCSFHCAAPRSDAPFSSRLYLLRRRTMTPHAAKNTSAPPKINSSSRDYPIHRQPRCQRHCCCRYKRAARLNRRGVKASCRELQQQR